MPYPKPFVRMSWLFTVLGSDEIAETSVHVTTLATGAFDAAAYVAGLTTGNGVTLYGLMSDLMGTANGVRWAEYSQLQGVKASALDATGHLISSPFTYDPGGSYSKGTISDVAVPSTIVMSLRTGTTFGTANYGRMYLPHTSFATISNRPYAVASVPPLLATAGGVLIQGVNHLSDIRVAGSGVVNLSKVGAGTVKPVNHVAIGNVVDTQRRRRNRLQETYDYAVVPA